MEIRHEREFLSEMNLSRLLKELDGLPVGKCMHRSRVQYTFIATVDVDALLVGRVEDDGGGNAVEVSRLESERVDGGRQEVREMVEVKDQNGP